MIPFGHVATLILHINMRVHFNPFICLQLLSGREEVGSQHADQLPQWLIVKNSLSLYGMKLAPWILPGKLCRQSAICKVFEWFLAPLGKLHLLSIQNSPDNMHRASQDCFQPHYWLLWATWQSGTLRTLTWATGQSVRFCHVTNCYLPCDTNYQLPTSSGPLSVSL